MKRDTISLLAKICLCTIMGTSVYFAYWIQKVYTSVFFAELTIFCTSFILMWLALSKEEEE